MNTRTNTKQQNLVYDFDEMDIKHDLQPLKDGAGEGCYANVYYSKKYPGIAVKIPKTCFGKFSETEKEIADNENEIIGMLIDCKTQNNNIVKYFKSHAYIVMELSSQGDLFNKVINRRRAEMPEQKWSNKLAYDLTSGLSFLHDVLRIIHADLKLENILLYENDEECIFKLTDFGLSKVLPKDKECVEQYCGSPHYCAPEIYSTKRLSFKSDIFALSVVLYTSLNGEYPFESENKNPMLKAWEIYNKQTSNVRPIITHCSESVEKIISQGWDKEYENRPTAKDAHEWMKQTVTKMGLFKEKTKSASVSSQYRDENDKQNKDDKKSSMLLNNK